MRHLLEWLPPMAVIRPGRFFRISSAGAGWDDVVHKWLRIVAFLTWSAFVRACGLRGVSSSQTSSYVGLLKQETLPFRLRGDDREVSSDMSFC